MSGRPPPARTGGHTLLEATVSLLLVLLLVSVAWRILWVHGRAADHFAHRGEALEAVRATEWILAREIRRSGSAGLSSVDADSFALRAFRGMAVFCAPGDPPVLRWRGSRRPDPEKDSVLVLDPDGRWSAHALLAVDRAPCGEGLPGGGRWSLDPSHPAPRLLRLFERGSYHLADGTLRYRRGGAGRQPLLPELLGDGSGLSEEGPVVRAVLELEPPPGRAAPGARTHGLVRSFRSREAGGPLP